MNTDLLAQLAEEWREEADLFERRGLEREARQAESYALDLVRTASRVEARNPHPQ